MEKKQQKNERQHPTLTFTFELTCPFQESGFLREDHPFVKEGEYAPKKAMYPVIYHIFI